MATQLLSHVVLQQVTQQVLPRVLQQLPELMARTQPGSPQQAPISDISRMNALAIGELRAEVGQARANTERDAARLDRLEARMTRLEQQTRWRRTALTFATAVVAYGIGLGTAVVLVLLGAFG
ncbi:MAG: hypothetical protein OXI70_15080 [Chloroflexota bacterium]|nr:hypothetical protein [Chloroflexota bacterium]